MNDPGKSPIRFIVGVLRMGFAFYGLALLAGILIYGGIGPASSGTGMGGAIAAGMASTFLYFICFILAIPATLWLGRWEKNRAAAAGLPPEGIFASFISAFLLGILSYLLIILALDQLLPGTLNPGLFFIVHSLIYFAIGWMIFNRPLSSPASSQLPSPRLSLGQVAMLSLAGLSLIFNGFQFYHPQLRNFPGGFPNVPVHKFTRLVMPADDQSGKGEYITQTIGSYDEVIKFYEQALSTNGWSVKAKWDYGNHWPTKMIASDGKQTLRLTIYGTRVDFQIDDSPCYRVIESEQCRTDATPELITSTVNESSEMTTYTNTVYGYSLTTPSSWQKSGTVYDKGQAAWVQWNDPTPRTDDSQEHGLIQITYSENFDAFLNLGLNSQQNETIQASNFSDFIVKDPDLTDVQSTTFKGDEAFIAKFKLNDQVAQEIYILHNGYIYNIESFGPVNVPNQSELDAVQKKIIDSFKFLD